MRFNFENDQTTKGRFAIQLAHFLDEIMIEDHADEVMEQADELYANGAIRFMVGRCYELSKHRRDMETLHGTKSYQYERVNEEWGYAVQFLGEMLS